MPPPRTGCVEPGRRADGTIYYRARIRLADESRERVDVPARCCVSREEAELYALAEQEREDETGALLAQKRARAAQKARERDPRNGETCTKYRERLDEYRVAMGRRTLRYDRSSWSKWIAPHIGPIPVTKVTRDNVERVRDALDEQIALHQRSGGKEGIGGKRSRNVWTVVTSMFKATVSAKKRDLRVREQNPCDGVLPPERTDSRRRTFVYPNEMLSLLRCAGVEREWRELYALGSYLYLRPGELRALTVGDIDFEANVVHVTKAWDENAKELKTPKTSKGVRDVPIHPNLLPLLRCFEKRGMKAPDAVAPLMAARSSYERARLFREHLDVAKVGRARLTENTATTMHVGFRSLRDTGITWLALAGVDVVKMQRRAGHERIETTGGYVKQAEDIGGTIGVPFPVLPASLLVTTVQAKDWAKRLDRRRKTAKKRLLVASPEGFEPSLAT
jgi:integrase